jgi:hypothetical protein
MSTRTEEPSHVVLRMLEQGVEIREYGPQIEPFLKWARRIDLLASWQKIYLAITIRIIG